MEVEASDDANRMLKAVRKIGRVVRVREDAISVVEGEDSRHMLIHNSLFPSLPVPLIVPMMPGDNRFHLALQPPLHNHHTLPHYPFPQHHSSCQHTDRHDVHLPHNDEEEAEVVDRSPRRELLVILLPIVRRGSRVQDASVECFV